MQQRFAILVVTALLMTACAPKSKTSDAVLLAGMSDTVPMQTYAMCSAAFGRSAAILPEKEELMMKASALYFQKAIQLSSKEAAAAAMIAHTEKYGKILRESGPAAQMEAFSTDIQACNAATAEKK